MSRDSKLPKTNSLLPSINYKQFISLTILLLVTSTTAQSPAAAKYDCPSGCECDESTFSASCDDLDELIASYSRKQHKSRQTFMPIKSLDLSNNQLTKLTNQLELLVNLTELNLSHNQLTQVHKLNFAQLEKLDLSYNRITSAKLKKLPKNVIHLNLEHNEISYLPVDFMKLKKLRSLELAGNPLNCTCNTLLVRNWITYQHVWTDKLIRCVAPSIVKGQPWLQARQNDICLEPSSTTTQRSKYNWDNYEDENEIMMNDQAVDDTEYEDEESEEEETASDKVEESSDKTPSDDVNMMNDQTADDGEKVDDIEYEDEESEEGETASEKVEESSDKTPSDDDENVETKDPFADENDKPEADEDYTPDVDGKSEEDEDFIAVSQEPEHDGSTVEPETVSKHVASAEYEDEGSGDENIVPVSAKPEDDTDESGSGGIPLIVPDRDDLESSTDEDETIAPLAIFEDNTESPIIVHKEGVSGAEVESEVINENIAPQTSGEINKASSDDNTGTYILLGILALCLVSLMAFVAMKNRKEKNRNRRYDVEKNVATELQDMDKRLLGKPLDRNGNNGNAKPEQAPLINDYPVVKDDRPSAYSSFHPPAITVDEPKAAPREKEKSQQSLYENVPNGNGHVEPVHQSPTNGGVPKGPESDDEIFLPANESPINPASLNVSPEPPKRYSPIYTPASPRSERYSPVYSPETGRVKIKLTETPKPKTPVVVTRSRSRAGEYINTPN